MNLATIGTRNILRNRFRTVFTVLGAVVAVLTFVTLRTVLIAWNAGVEYAIKDRIIVANKISFTLDLPKRYIDTVRGVQGVASACYLTWFGGKDPKDPRNTFRSFAMEDKCLDVFDELSIEPAEKTSWLADRKGAIIGNRLAQRLGVKVGDRVTLKGTGYSGDWQFNVSAIYHASLPSVDRSQFMFHWDYLNESIAEDRRERIGWVMAKIADADKSAEISRTIDQLFDAKEVPTTTMSQRAMNISLMAMISGVLSALEVVSLIILFIMMMVLGNTIAMGVRERTREYGVLRAIGFGQRDVIVLVLGEALTIGVIAGVIGVALSYPIVERGLGGFLVENAGNAFPHFKIAPATLAAAVTSTIVLSIVAAVFPAYRASRLTVTDALRRVV